jgi:uncharacterized membrane protein
MRRISILLTCTLLLALCNSCEKKEYNTFATLHGIVNDHDTGELIDVATIVLSPGGKTTTTGSDGRYEFLNLEPQQYTVTVQKNGYNTNRKTITAVSGENTEANIPLTKIK